jgi:ABC-type Fe3+ transport system permease subunit
MKGYLLAVLLCVVLAIPYTMLVRRANANIERNCTALGGQTLIQPGAVSRCLLPPAT